MAATDATNRDLTLPPDTYAYLQNETKGSITVHRGPTLVNCTGQDKPVRYDPQTRRYQQCGLENAVQQFPRAAEGDYVILENPSEDGTFPNNAANPSKDLKKGRKIVIPGPWSEALYPGQHATVLEGHRLRSNQYLVAIIYNDKEAEENWEKGTVAKAQTTEHTEDQAPTAKTAKGLPKPDSFAVGTRIVICGSDVSFYIPCTGVEVLRDDTDGKFVRDAVTLEQSEYCRLIDENGKNEYPRGPKVVFPKPTQVFDKDNKGRRKFKPIELNTINGLHLKVTADFEDEDLEQGVGEGGKRPNRKYKEGEELFITGKTMSIYYPREQLVIIEYGAGNKKHYSTAIPKGEGRYVIQRESGSIRVERGPEMYLADPRKEIPVRRVLSDDECKLWYPNNTEALAYNQSLASVMATSASGRSGVVSEGDYRKDQMKRMRGSALESANYMMAAAAGGAIAADYEEFSPEEVGDESSAPSIQRGTKFTQPRTLTLNTKYDGVPKIEVWPGFAVLIVGSEGSRRVEVGPEVILLEYDEKLGFMELSTGKPKSTDKLMRTAYLCVQNNQVGDIVGFESKDHVKGKIKISLRVNFEAETKEERLKWFGTDNYVKFLTDHVRSVIAGTTKKLSVADVKSDYVNIIRNAILGTKADADSKRPGMSFENGMRVTEVEVLELTLDDPKISQMLDAVQTDVVRANIEIQQAEKDLEATKAKERIAQEKARAQYGTKKIANELATEQIQSQLEVALATIGAELQKLGEEKKRTEANEDTKDLTARRDLAREKALADQRQAEAEAQQKLKIDLINAETEAVVKRFQEAKDGLHETLIALGRDEMATKLAEAVNIERYLAGGELGSSVANILSFAPSLKAFFERGEQIQGNGNRLTQGAAKK